MVKKSVSATASGGPFLWNGSAAATFGSNNPVAIWSNGEKAASDVAN